MSYFATAAYDHDEGYNEPVSEQDAKAAAKALGWRIQSEEDGGWLIELDPTSEERLKRAGWHEREAKGVWFFIELP